MATDYYKMGLGLGSAYHEGQEENRLRQRQITEDERKRLVNARDDAQFERTLGIQRNMDKALEEQQVLVQQGAYKANTAGMSDPAAQALYQSGGQALVDTTARLGNEEDARYGLQYPSAQVSSGTPYGGSQYQGEATQFEAPLASPPRYAVSGLNSPTIQTNKATERDLYNSDMNVALASKNPAAIAGLRARGKELDINDTIAADMVRARTDPAFRQKLFAQVNQDSNIFTVIEATTTAPASVTWVDSKGVGQSKPLSENDLNRVISGLAHIQHGQIPKGIAELGAIDDRFKVLAAAEVKTKLEVVASNTASLTAFNANLKAKENIAEMARHHRATEGTNRDAKASSSGYYDAMKAKLEKDVEKQVDVDAADKRGRAAGKVFTDKIAEKDSAHWAKNPAEHQMLLEKAGQAYFSETGNYILGINAQMKLGGADKKVLSDLHKTQLAGAMKIIQEDPDKYPPGSAKIFSLFRQAGLTEEFIEKELGHPNVDGRNARAVKLNTAIPFAAGITEDKMVDGQVYSKGGKNWKWNAETKKMDPHTPPR